MARVEVAAWLLPFKCVKFKTVWAVKNTLTVSISDHCLKELR